MASVFPDWRVRIACAALFIVLPGMDMVLGSITFIQFYLAAFLIAAALAAPARTTVGAVLTRASLLVASLTGPFSVLFLPLYLARLAVLRNRDSAWSLAAVGLGAFIQVIALLTAGARGAASSTVAPWDVVRVIGLHLATGFTGTRLMTDLAGMQPPAWVAGVAIAALATLLLLSLRAVPRAFLLVTGYVLAATIGSSLLNGSDSTAVLLDPLSASRYFVIPWFVIGVLLIVSAAARNRVALALLAVLAVGIVADFRLPSGWNYGWSAAAACVGGPDPCDLRIFPGIPYWTFAWPGLAATNDAPGP
jgi:hypothetical protein